jgi:SAM-dependent methyltransferase
VTTPPIPQVRQQAVERQRWDAIARSIPDYHSASSTQYYRRREIDLLRRYVGPLQDKRVLKLDLWNEAINTRILHWMRAEGASTFGIDLSEVVTSRAGANARLAPGSLSLARADIRHLPFATASFDLVYTMGTIEHIDEFQQAVDEAHRVLRPGGVAIVGVPHKWNIYLRPALVRVLDWLGLYAFAPEKCFSAPALRQVLERSGLVRCRRTGILAIPPVVRMADLFLFRREIHIHPLTTALIEPFERLERRWAWVRRLGYLVVMVGVKPGADE